MKQTPQPCLNCGNHHPCRYEHGEMIVQEYCDEGSWNDSPADWVFCPGVDYDPHPDESELFE